MAVICQQNGKGSEKDREFCRALLNHENPLWENSDLIKVRRKGFCLPPDDFIYGLKHPKQNGMTGVAAALQHYHPPMNTTKATTIPDFIAINKIATRLGLTKVRDIHQYRRTMNNHSMKRNPCPCAYSQTKTIPDIIHGRPTSQQEWIGDVIQNRYLHEWLYQMAVRRCREMCGTAIPRKTKTCLYQQHFNTRRT